MNFMDESVNDKPEILQFIDYAFPFERDILYNSLLYINSFNCDIESELENIIFNDDVDEFQKRDHFYRYIRLTLMSLIESKGFSFSPETELGFLNDIVWMLHFIEALDNYQQVEIILSQFDKNAKELFYEIMEYYMQTDMFKYFNFVRHVDDSVIEMIESMIDRRDTPVELVNGCDHARFFSAFMGEHDFIAKKIYKSSMSNLNVLGFKDIVFITDFQLKKEFDSEAVNYKNELTQHAVDLLSILLIAVDSCKDPLMYVDQHQEEIFHDRTTYVFISRILQGIYNDYIAYKKSATK